MSNKYYIASCVFTSRFPHLSFRIQEDMKNRYGCTILRCCVPKYKLAEFESRMPEGACREAWRALPDCAPFARGDVVYSLCHNCNNILSEVCPEAVVRSLWELLASDDALALPDHSDLSATLQDCWRARDRSAEHDAVRLLLSKMHISYLETPENREQTEFCGLSLYRPQPPRNPKLAPKHYVEGAKG